jgi:pimeloyl-ACP methyl ester carboxylesterase
VHGLAGHAEEWGGTAAALTPRHRVLAMDARGHGRSERRPDDVSRDAHISDVDMMERPLREAVALDLWEAWERVACPTLVVRGEAGTLPSDVAREMVARLPGAQLVELAEAGHDVHLDRPREWTSALLDFLREVA